MPTVNSKKDIFTSINIKYIHDAYDVFTEGMRFLYGKIPDTFYVKCLKCFNKVKMNKDCFGPSDFLMICNNCEDLLASCVRSDVDFFYISL